MSVWLCYSGDDLAQDYEWLSFKSAIGECYEVESHGYESPPEFYFSINVLNIHAFDQSSDPVFAAARLSLWRDYPIDESSGIMLAQRVLTGLGEKVANNEIGPQFAEKLLSNLFSLLNDDLKNSFKTAFESASFQEEVPLQKSQTQKKRL